MLRIRVLSSASALLATVASSAVAQSAPQSAGTRQNPFLEPSPLFFQAPPFDKIRDGDYQPALEEGMREQLAEVNRIANQTSAPTFDNTIVAMERSGALLTRVSKVFFGLTDGEHERHAADDPGRSRRRSSPRTATRSTSTRSCSRA